MQLHTQADNITTNLIIKIDFTSPELNATKIMTWNCHVDESAKRIYDMVLGRDIFKALVIYLKLSEHFIEEDDENFKASTTPMVDLGTYEFKYLNMGGITPE